ncbi:MAG: hypothetical protein REI09_05485 [Candidatus Dactylopiibacterium sp.]|nr:hypothetical protein [Candidatus Dactylopiibacterium sp.]
MPESPLSAPLTHTCFDLESYAYKAGQGELPTIDASLAHATLNLAVEPAQGRLHHWQLEAARQGPTPLTPAQILGAVVRIARGRTSPIAFVDPMSRRVRTASGTVYELGLPHPAYAEQAPGVLESLGFRRGAGR